jgi:NTE family protein
MRSPARRSALLRALAAGATVPVVSAMGVLSACTVGPGADHDGPQAPRAGTLAWPEGAGRRMAWVFSSGGPRCFVHVGVVKALEQMGVQPDAVVGASGGALIAAMVAARWPAAEIERVALDVGPTDLVRLSLGTDERFSGNGIAAWVNELLRERARTQLLEELPLPAAVVAVAQRSREPLALAAGDAGVAVQASCAIEGTLAPVRVRGMPLVDADLVMPLPVRVARGLGAQRVLAVDASAHEQRAPPGAERFREGDRRKRALTQPDAVSADLTLHPDFGYWVSLSREFRQRAIDAGFRDTLAQAQRLRALHA